MEHKKYRAQVILFCIGIAMVLGMGLLLAGVFVLGLLVYAYIGVIGKMVMCIALPFYLVYAGYVMYLDISSLVAAWRKL